MESIDLDYEEPESFAEWISSDFGKSLPKMLRETKKMDCPKCSATIIYRPNDDIYCWNCSWNSYDYDEKGNPVNT